MRKFLAGTGIAAILAVSASGADAQNARAYNWTGLYVGADLGYLIGKPEIFPDNVVGVSPAKPDASFGQFGVHIGQLWQVSPVGVVGWEIDYWRSEASGIDNYAPIATAGQIELKSGASARVTAGYSVGSSLAYVTGGYSRLSYEGCSTGGINISTCGALTNFSKDKSGWTAGAGYAHAFSPQFVARIEYLYADYGKETFTTPGIGGSLTSVDLTTHTVRLGLSWRFGAN